MHTIYILPLVLLQNFADPSIRNTEGKTPLDLADPQAKLVLSGSVGMVVTGLHQAMLMLQVTTTRMNYWKLLVSDILKS